MRGQMNAAEQQLQQSLETIPLEQQRLFLEVWNQVPQVDEADLLGYKMRELKLAGRNYLHALKQFSDFRYLTDLATHDVMIALQSLMSAVDVLKRDMKDTFGIGRRWEERFDALIQLCRKENTSLEAKLNPDQLRYGYSSIGKLIHECVDTHIPQAKERLIDFKIDLEQLLGEEGKHKVLNIYMDRIALGQAINNVIDNAVKYSFSGTIDHHRWIDILGRSESIGGTPGYRVMVSNLGVGIEEDELKLVFKRGYQGRRRLGEDRSGSGIGLTFVKECIEQHGGTISIRSQPQRRTGWLTVVSVWLPIHGHADNYSQEV